MKIVLCLLPLVACWSGHAPNRLHCRHFRLTSRTSSTLAPYRSDRLAVRLQAEGESRSSRDPDPASETATTKRKQAQTDVLDRASDPFRAVRQVIFVIFAVVGFAGCGLAIMQMGSNPSDSVINLAVNAAVPGSMHTSLSTRACFHMGARAHTPTRMSAWMHISPFHPF